MKTIRTTCPYCGVGCGVLASVDDAGQVSVRGDDQHPANLGRLCVKGAALGETTGLAGRLLTPEVDGQQVAWPQALAETAARLRQIIDQHGPQAVAFYASGQLLTEDYYAANKLMKGFIGAANIDTNSRLCMSSAVTGYKRAFGADVVPCSYDDVENSDLVVLVGSNAAWAHPVLFQRLAQAKRDNPRLRIVAIDPRRTATCEIADRHLALAPGSDGGLFAGLLNALAEAGACVDGFRDGPQALAAARGWDVARVAAFCGLPADEVAGFYREFIAAPRAITLYTMGINQSASGSDKCNAIINVHLASGKYGRRGCGPFSLTGQPNAMGGREVGGLATMLAAHMDFVPDDLQRLARFWGTERLAQTPGLTAVELFAAIGRGEVKAVWIMGTNPVVSLPDSHAVSQALAACPLVIVSDVAAQTDTGRFAHIRFPALAWGEKNGTVTNSERRISRQRSFLPPPGEAKADWWIIARVGQALGYREAFAWQHPHDVFREHAALSGALLRVPYAFMVPLFGGRRWTAFSTGIMIVPCVWLGFAVQDTSTPFSIFVIISLLCGFAGANFASSMANISFFFPKAKQVGALGVNGGLGNMGVSVMQLVAPLVVSISIFAVFGGNGSEQPDGSMLYLENAAWIWVPFLIIFTLAAWFFMNDLSASKASLSEQLPVLKRLHLWIMALLYLATFGSFIGFSAGFAMLSKTQFPDVQILHYAFFGPFIGALARSMGGAISDRLGGTRVTLVNFVVMAVFCALLFLTLPTNGQGGNFIAFFAVFMVLFLTAGLGSASTFQMISVIFRKLTMDRVKAQGGSEAQAMREAATDTAAALGFISAIGAIGGFFIPKAFGISLDLTGSPAGAMKVFLVFYIACVVITWAVYGRKRQ